MSVEEPENTVEPEPAGNVLYARCEGCQYDDPIAWQYECYVCSRYYPEVTSHLDLYSKIPEMSYGTHKLLPRNK